MAAVLRGKNVAFTGTFENMKRNEVVKKAKSLGGMVHGRGATVSKNIDVLVTGDSNVGIKKVKAKQLGIQILPATSFHRFVRSGGADRVARASAMATAAPRRGRPPMKAELEEEDEFDAAPVRRGRPAMKRMEVVEDFEEDYEQEEDDVAAMPWMKTADTESFSASTRRGRPAMKRMEAIERPVRKTRTTMAVAPKRVERVAPAARRAAFVPFWELRGKNVAFTGNFEQLKKTEAAVMAERNGATVSGMSNVDILVCGKGCEAKRMLAKKKGILAVSEAKFIAACRK